MSFPAPCIPDLIHRKCWSPSPVDGLPFHVCIYSRGKTCGSARPIQFKNKKRVCGFPEVHVIDYWGPWDIKSSTQKGSRADTPCKVVSMQVPSFLGLKGWRGPNSGFTGSSKVDYEPPSRRLTVCCMQDYYPAIPKLNPSSSMYLNPRPLQVLHYPPDHIIPCPSHQPHESSLSEPGLPAWHAPSPFGTPESKMSPLSRQSQKATAILPLVPWLSTLQPSR